MLCGTPGDADVDCLETNVTDAVNDHAANDCCEVGAPALSKIAVCASRLTEVDISRFGVGSRIARNSLVSLVWVLGFP